MSYMNIKHYKNMDFCLSKFYRNVRKNRILKYTFAKNYENSFSCKLYLCR